MARSIVLKVKNEDYMAAARIVGGRDLHIMIKYSRKQLISYKIHLSSAVITDIKDDIKIDSQRILIPLDLRSRQRYHLACR